MSTPNKRPGMPKPDRAHLGQYLPMTPQTHPESFRNPTEQAAWRARRAEVEAYLRLSEDDATAAPTARPTVAGTEESDDDVPEPDDSGDEDWQPGPSRRRSTATRRQAAPIPAQTADSDDDELSPEELVEAEQVLKDAEDDSDNNDEDDDDDDDDDSDVPLDVNSKGWKVGNPKSYPQKYDVPTDLAGGKKVRKVNFNINFSSKESVNKANKARRLALWRANKDIGGRLKRAPTGNRVFTQANDNWILAEYARYAGANNGRRMPPDELTKRYNIQFPTEGRTQNSLNSHIDHVTALKNARLSYSPY